MRPDLDLVQGLVGPRSHVIDLGCGDGALLARLIGALGCTGYGVERSSEGFHACVARGVPVIQGDLEAELERLDGEIFDLAVLSLTLQATARPAFVLRQMARIARRSIVSLPNMGNWRHRADLALRGRMPVGGALPYSWHETPNIHLCTLGDLEALLAEMDLRVLRRLLLSTSGGRARASGILRPNLLAAGAVYLVEPAGSGSA